MSYHVSPNGPSLCHAKLGRCPYGANGANHFSTVKQAAIFYEVKMKEAFGGFEGVTKTAKQERKERTYAVRDRFVALGYAIKASKPVTEAAASVKNLHDAPLKTAIKVQAASVAAWKKLKIVASTTKELVSDGAAGLARANKRFGAYTSQVSIENKARMAEYQKYVNSSSIRSGLTKETQAAATGKPRQTGANELRLGDKLENGTIITGMKVVKGVTTISTRNPVTGHFGKGVKLTNEATVGIIRPRRQALRQANEAYNNIRAGANHRAAIVSGSVKMQTRGFFDSTTSRVKLAANLQRQSFNTLMGIDRSVLSNRSSVARHPAVDLQSIHRLKA